MVQTADEELIEMFQAGEVSAFEELFCRYRKPIYSFLCRRTGNAEVAADLTQDVFTKVIQKTSPFSGQSKFSTWLYTIARNAAVDHLRKARHRQHASLDQREDTAPSLGDRIAAKTRSPDMASESGNLQEALLAAIAALPDDQREVFLLREYQGMPFHEIAAVVNAPVGTVKSRMRYALDTLRHHMQSYAEYTKDTP